MEIPSSLFLYGNGYFSNDNPIEYKENPTHPISYTKYRSIYQSAFRRTQRSLGRSVIRGTVTVTFMHVPTNSLLGTYTIEDVYLTSAGDRSFLD
jgi:hypothetical protein